MCLLKGWYEGIAKGIDSVADGDGGGGELILPPLSMMMSVSSSVYCKIKTAPALCTSLILTLIFSVLFFFFFVLHFTEAVTITS